MRVSRALLLAALGATALAARPRPARACATCGCGDPTLTQMGSEKPFSGRLRLAAETRYTSVQIGDAGVDREDVSEWRLEASLAWAPRAWLFLSLTAPLVHRRTEYVNLAQDTVVNPGDVELRAKAFVYQDRAFSPHHLVALVGGVKLPTAPRATGPTDMPLPYDAQTGSGSFDPLAGVAYGSFFAPWSFYASAMVRVPTTGFDDVRVGPSLRTTAAAQWQPGTDWAFQLGVDTRYEAAALDQGQEHADTGGFIAFASPRVAYSPATDLLLHAGASIPLVSRFDGAHREGLVASVGATYDF